MAVSVYSQGWHDYTARCDSRDLPPEEGQEKMRQPNMRLPWHFLRVLLFVPCSPKHVNPIVSLKFTIVFSSSAARGISSSIAITRPPQNIISEPMHRIGASDALPVDTCRVNGTTCRVFSPLDAKRERRLGTVMGRGGGGGGLLRGQQK